MNDEMDFYDAIQPTDSLSLQEMIERDMRSQALDGRLPGTGCTEFECPSAHQPLSELDFTSDTPTLTDRLALGSLDDTRLDTDLLTGTNNLWFSTCHSASLSSGSNLDFDPNGLLVNPQTGLPISQTLQTSPQRSLVSVALKNNDDIVSEMLSGGDSSNSSSSSATSSSAGKNVTSGHSRNHHHNQRTSFISVTHPSGMDKTGRNKRDEDVNGLTLTHSKTAAGPTPTIRHHPRFNSSMNRGRGGAARKDGIMQEAISSSSSSSSSDDDDDDEEEDEEEEEDDDDDDDEEDEEKDEYFIKSASRQIKVKAKGSNHCVTNGISKLNGRPQVTINGATLVGNSERTFPKPAYSYSCLIAMALKNSKTGSLPVSEIYSFMTENFPYFKTAPNGWKNSVRHNLSLNKCFEKIEKPGHGSQRKGCLWAMNPCKIEKMDEEVLKWNRKDPLAIRQSMAKPENFELLEKGCLKANHQQQVSLPERNGETFKVTAKIKAEPALQDLSGLESNLYMDNSLLDLNFQTGLWGELDEKMDFDIPLASDSFPNAQIGFSGNDSSEASNTVGGNGQNGDHTMFNGTFLSKQIRTVSTSVLK